MSLARLKITEMIMIMGTEIGIRIVAKMVTVTRYNDNNEKRIHETFNNRPDWPFDVVNRFRNQEG